MERGEAYWTWDAEAGAWYFGLKPRAAPPFLKQIEAMVILDIDSEGRLAGVELLEPLLPSRAAPVNPTPLEFDEASPGGICHLGHDWIRNLTTAGGQRCVRCGETRP